MFKIRYGIPEMSDKSGLLGTIVSSSPTSSILFGPTGYTGHQGPTGSPNIISGGTNKLLYNNSGAAFSTSLATINGSVINISNLQISNLTTNYAPISLLGGTVEFYGDSITLGIGLSVQANRYSTLLSTQYGWTELNTAVSGDLTYDCVTKVYNNHVGGRTSFINIGFNDITVTTVTDKLFYQSRNNYECMLLYLSLPSNNVVNTRSASVIKTGTWNNTTFTTLGMYTTTSGATASTTCTGRYVGFALTLGANITVTIDGVVICTGLLLPASGITTPNGTAISQQIFLYDTFSSIGSTHTVLITNATATNLDIDWFFGFDTTTNFSSVIAISPDQYDFSQTNAPYIGGTPARRNTMLQIQREACHKLRTEYNCKTYFVDASTGWPAGFKGDDGVHPNPSGHKYIQNRVNSVLASGEFTTWM
ncbi:MAG: hypothetical protein PHG66_01125 [Candidatus Colwellbacteria bacterium]|nr:hypothetical protein [Candidatus Colwellbacteria bacterium]